MQIDLLSAAWTQVPSPSRALSTNSLDGVAATSTTNAWAVGGYSLLAGSAPPLVEHWDGTAWTQVASPRPSGVLLGFAARYSNVGAVGYYDDNGVYHPLALHF